MDYLFNSAKLINTSLLGDNISTGHQIHWMNSNSIGIITDHSIMVCDLMEVKVKEMSSHLIQFPISKIKSLENFDIKKVDSPEKPPNCFEKKIRSKTDHFMKCFICLHCGRKYLMAIFNSSSLLSWIKKPLLEWNPLDNITSLLEIYWSSNISEANEDNSSLTTITCIEWLDFYKLDNFNATYGCGVLCTATESSHLIFWTLKEDEENKTIIKVCQVFSCGEGTICAIKMCDNDQKLINDCSLSICVAFTNGKLVAIEMKFDKYEKTFSFTQPKLIWKDEDYLQVKSISWFRLSADENALIFSKANAVICLKLNSHLKVIDKFMDLKKHMFEIVAIRGTLTTKNEIEVVSISCDGCASKIYLKHLKSLKFVGFQSILNPEDVDEYLLTADISPNSIYLATLYSRSKVTKSILEENESTLNVFVIKADSRKIKQLVQNIESPLTLSDWFVSLRHLEGYYPEIEKLVQVLPTNVKELQFVWSILYNRRKTFENFKESFEDCEKKLLVMQMHKILLNAEQQLESKKSNNLKLLCFVTEVIKWINLNKDLSTKMDFSKLWPILNRLKNHKLPNAVCLFTLTSLSLSKDAKEYISSEGVYWPACCLTFLPIQSFQRRICTFCGISSLSILSSYPSWLKSLLMSPCPLCNGKFL